MAGHAAPPLRHGAFAPHPAQNFAPPASSVPQPVQNFFDASVPPHSWQNFPIGTFALHTPHATMPPAACAGVAACCGCCGACGLGAPPGNCGWNCGWP